MTLQLGGDGAITGCTSLENPDLIASGLTTSGSVDAGKVLVASGTAAAPSYTFSGDTDNGLYYAGTNSIGLATAGTNAILIDSSNRVGIGTTSPSDLLHVRVDASGDQSVLRLSNANATQGNTVGINFAPANDIVSVAIKAIAEDSHDAVPERDGALGFFTRLNGGSVTEKTRIDSSGRLLVGTSSVITNSYGGTAGRFQVAKDDFLPTGFFTYSDNGGETGYCPYVELHRARGTQASPSAVANTDDLGIIHFYGHDGSTFIRSASIKSVVDGTPGTNDMPGRLVFSTTPDGDSSPDEVMRITPDKYVRLASGTGGIQFGGDTAAANALDDYEEGTFTPNLVLITGGTTEQTIAPLSTSYKGRYIKIGHRVWVNIYVRYNLSTITATSWSQALIELPFAQGSFGGQQYAAGSIGYLAQFLALPTSADSNHYFPGVYVGSNTNYLYPTVNQMNGAEVYLTQTYLTRNASAGFMANAHYSVESF